MMTEPLRIPPPAEQEAPKAPERREPGPSSPGPGPLRRFLARVWAMAFKEALHIRRDPRTLALALIMPVLLLLLFGYGVSFDLDRIPVAVVDLDRSPLSRQVAEDLLAARELVGTEVRDVEAAEAGMRRGDVLGAIVIPAGHAERRLAGAPGPVQLLVDGADGVVANQLMAKAEAFLRAAAAEDAPPGATPPFDVRVFTRFNPAGRSALYLVPGLAAYLLAMAAVLLTSLTVAGEWERGSMEQLFASPVGRLEIVIGKLLPYLALGFLQLLLVLAVGAWAFGVPIYGSLTLVFVLGLLFLLGMLGQGLLISVLTRDQLVATQAGALSGLLPSLLLSGMLFPIENMPWILQAISYAVPARYMVHALRGILLKGVGLEVLWPDLVAQVVFAVVVIGLATLRFRRRVA